MNVIERILEEIEEEIKFAESMMVEKPCNKLDKITNDTAEAFIGAYKECSKIIRSHIEHLPNVDAEEKSILCTVGEDGVLSEYDDTYDVVIHCTSKEDQEQTVKCIKDSNWIPVSERLPEPYETVLVSAKMKNDTEYFVYEAIKTSSMWLLAGVVNSIDYEVVAWKPLPEPYRPTEG
ncbi:DUF551 domain-containing protein [Parablautia sp. Marseille-Q6255]|uniref:DUF551 domain-containing protein n=1 Tax=Parablautia sp. Marseille-Q6255 TaxID=3039593 RepID=UPI0024BCCDFE|nr:DUF551 domain-containing protein [Parablautia sp. Marseille-Q6255]